MQRLTMEFTALCFLWLLSAFTLTTQELVGLKVSPTLSAECGKQVSLHCNASSSQHGLLISHMEWSQDKMPLCSVDNQENITMYEKNSTSDFRCEYEDGRLSLVFQEVLPLEAGRAMPYRCKLHSNQGMPHEYTRVELQECCGTVESVLRRDGPSCTFNHVYPDGDVHWFHDSRNLSDESVRHATTKTVDGQGWVTIHSWLTFPDNLEWRSSNVPYNCSLTSTTSGRYIASSLVRELQRVRAPLPSKGCKTRLPESITTVLSVLFSLIIALKHWT